MTLQLDLPSEISSFLAKPVHHLIDGKEVPSIKEASFDSIDPGTGQTIATVALGGAKDIDAAVDAARRALDGPWARLSPSARGQLLWRLADLIEQRSDEFAALEAIDSGKPVTYAKAVDLALTTDWFRYFAGWTTKLEGSTIPVSAVATPGDYFAYTSREPVGVVGAVIAWNFPLMLAAWKLAPALAAGNTVVLKPAEQTPLTAALLGEVIREAGFPDGVVNVVQGNGEQVGAALAAHPGVDKISFTGSTEVGKLIIKAAAGNLKKVTLELGGKSPNIVFNDADLASAIPGSAASIFFNQGEACTAGSRLFVQSGVYDEVVAGIAEAAGQMKVGYGLDPDSQVGPLVSDKQLATVLGYLDSGRQQGAEAIVGGGQYGDKGYYVQPTVLVNTTPGMKVVDEEIFGPVLTVQKFDDESEVVDAANSSIYGLAAGVWTTNTARALRVSSKLKAGTVWVNTYNIFDPALPFGGYKQSGWGREHGSAVFDAYTETKTTVIPRS